MKTSRAGMRVQYEEKDYPHRPIMEIVKEVLAVNELRQREAEEAEKKPTMTKGESRKII